MAQLLKIEYSINFRKHPVIFFNKCYVTGSRLRVLDVVKHLYTPESTLTDQLKFSLIKNSVLRKTDQMRYKICKNKRKKCGTSQRYCPHDWFHTFKFNCYSKSEAGLFCLACVLFPMPAQQGSRAKILICHPYNVWKHGSKDLKGHSILQYHKDSMAHFESLVTTMKSIKSRVEHRANTNSEDTIKQSRKFISSFNRGMEYCGRQVIGLRGHRDDGSIFDNYDSNQENFRELFKLTAEIDKNLDTYLCSNMCSKCYLYFRNHTERVAKLYKGLHSELNSS